MLCLLRIIIKFLGSRLGPSDVAGYEPALFDENARLANGILKSTKGLTDNMISQLKTYGKQLDNLRPSKILSNSAEALSDSLRHADNVISEAAQNFRMNIGLDPKLADGVLSSGGGQLTHLADNLSAFAKNLDGSVEELSENTVKFFEKPLSTIDRFNEIDIVSYVETMKKIIQKLMLLN